MAMLYINLRDVVTESLELVSHLATIGTADNDLETDDPHRQRQRSYSIARKLVDRLRHQLNRDDLNLLECSNEARATLELIAKGIHNYWVFEFQDRRSEGALQEPQQIAKPPFELVWIAGHVRVLRELETKPMDVPPAAQRDRSVSGIVDQLRRRADRLETEWKKLPLLSEPSPNAPKEEIDRYFEAKEHRRRIALREAQTAGRLLIRASVLGALDSDAVQLAQEWHRDGDPAGGEHRVFLALAEHWLTPRRGGKEFVHRDHLGLGYGYADAMRLYADEIEKTILVGQSSDVQPQSTSSEFQFAPVGRSYLIAGFGESGRLRKLRGFDQLYRLIQTPGLPVSMVELAGGGHDERITNDQRSRQPMLDEQTKREIKDELRDLRMQHEQSKRNNDIGTAEKIGEQIEEIESWLKRSMGIGSKDRDLNDRFEKLRPTIWASINRAIKALRTEEPPLNELADHFDASISSESGAFIYRPIGNPRPDWSLEIPTSAKT